MPRITSTVLEDIAEDNGATKCDYPIHYHFPATTKADKKRVFEGNVVDKAGLFWHIANNAGFIVEYDFKNDGTVVIIKGER